MPACKGGGRNSTPEALKGGPFPPDICVHFNVLSAPPPEFDP